VSHAVLDFSEPPLGLVVEVDLLDCLPQSLFVEISAAMI